MTDTHAGGTAKVRAAEPSASRHGSPLLGAHATTHARIPATRIRQLAAVAAAGSTAYVLVKVWLTSWHHRLLDFAVYMLGAHHLNGHLYAATLSPPPHLLFTYTPFAALSFGLLVWIPFQWAQLLWCGICVCSLLAILVLVAHAARPRLARRDAVVLALVLMAPAYRFEPVLLTFAFGQVNLVLCALVLADLVWTPRIGDRRLPRGVLVGIAAAVKLVPLVFVPYLFLTRQVRAGWTALGTFIACSLVAAAADPSVAWPYWTKYADDARRIGAVFYISNQSIRGVADRLAHHTVSATLLTAMSVVLLIAGLVLARWSWQASSNLLGVLVCATTGIMVSPISWAHHFVWAVPVVLWLALAADRPPGGPLWAAAATVFFWISPIWFVPNGGNRELSESGWQQFVGNSFFWVAAVFMLGVAVMLSSRRRRHRASHRPARVTAAAGLAHEKR